ncbi:MAG TPA: GMC family oxidoreductase N-terminal domain-containing protein, partial [Casimicrobiaceae bacterium]|nr:GMC family oxidoreductase N-terminal domain-containing protein [Casimicrobiaceae bacterium]
MSDTTAHADPYRSPLARSWNIVDASRRGDDLTLECDVAIVGSGAGGGTTAEVLASAGYKVVIVEEGPLATSADFHMREAEAYPELYQDCAGRRTRDKAINILQGRCVGGSTTVNWTSSFRTPAATLAHWQRVHGVDGYAADDLAPWFERMEARLSIAPWTVAPNANNAALMRGAGKLGIPVETIARNVRGCADLGYCGVGCPINAKQSMLVTTIPVALERGATLVTRARAMRLSWTGERVTSLQCIALDPSGAAPSGAMVTVRARAFVCAAGAIGTPALLLRSRVPDPHGLVGTRTFLHPVVVSA